MEDHSVNWEHPRSEMKATEDAEAGISSLIVDAGLATGPHA